MTPEQTAIVKAAILADPALAPLTSGEGTDYQAIALAMSADASPAFTVWRTSVPRAEYQDDDAFNWTQVDNLSTGGKYRIWEWMFGTTGSINPSKANIRAGIAACWVGNASLLAVQAMVLAKSKRNATRVEKVLATGAGSDAAPALLTYEGGLSLGEVASMFNA
jgi:hypothetical protein